MKPAARMQAAIELLDGIIIAARDNGASADTIAKKFFKARRYAGSKDRRAIREHVYQAIRRFGDRPSDARSAMAGLVKENPQLASLFDGSDYGPKKLERHETACDGPPVPVWLKARFAKLIDGVEENALFERASLDIRTNPKAGSGLALEEIWPDIRPLPLAGAFRLPSGTKVENSQPYEDGLVEVQDLGSQLIVHACLGETSRLVLDLCAGAGGKALGLAAQLPDTARIIAADADRRRLSNIAPRIKRGGVENIETILLSPDRELEALGDFEGRCDLVLVDAPCSGTGTWRRNPELRWRMTSKRLNKTTALQARLMDLGSKLTASGGMMVYAVCSLLDAEGGDQTDIFLKNHPDWQQIDVDLPLGRPYRKGTLLTPYHDGTDGFYFTCLRKL